MEMKQVNDKSEGLGNSSFRRLGGIIMVMAMLIGVMEGCRSTKSIRKAMAVQHTDSVRTTTTVTENPKTESQTDLRKDSLRVIHEAVTKMGENKINFTTFSAKIKVNYEGAEGNGTDFTAYVRVQKDSMIWVSITAVLGIEAFRMLITRDSVIILDKLKKVARLRSVSYLQQEIHLPVDFHTLQDLLVGNPIYLDTGNILFYNKEKAGLSLMSVDSLFKNYFTLNSDDNTVKHSKMDDTDPMRARTCDLTYGDYEQRDGMRFSTYRKISVAEKSKLDLELNFKQYSFNMPLSFSFLIPKNYKRK
jgi:hypothetical protein